MSRAETNDQKDGIKGGDSKFHIVGDKSTYFSELSWNQCRVVATHIALRKMRKSDADNFQDTYPMSESCTRKFDFARYISSTYHQRDAATNSAHVNFSREEIFFYKTRGGKRL